MVIFTNYIFYFLNILKVPTEELRTKIINFLTVLMAKFFFVAKTMGGMHPNSIASLYFEISKLISNTPTDYQLCTEKCHTKIIQKGSFDIFKAKIEHEIYSRQATTSSKYLLYFLELFYTVKSCIDKCLIVASFIFVKHLGFCF